MIYRLFGLALLYVGWSGIAQAETISFSPPDGSTRSYHFETTTRIGTPEEEDYYSGTRHSSALVRLMVRHRDPAGDPELEVFPLWTASRDRDTTLSTALGFLPDTLRAAYRRGFVATVDTESGRISELNERNSAERAPAIFGLVPDALSQAVVPGGIEVREGWHGMRAMEGPTDVDVRVTRVTPDRVFLHYEGESDLIKLSGLSVVERDTGWVARAAMTFEAGLVPGDPGSGHIRQTLVMVPASGAPVTRADAATGDPEWHRMPTHPLPAVPEPPEPDQIFAHPFGEALNDETTLFLRFGHDVAPGAAVGRFEIGELRLYEGETPLETTLMPSAVNTWTRSEVRQDTREVSVESQFLLRPTGLSDARRDMARTTAVRAQVKWYRPDPVLFTLRPDAQGRAEIRRDGINLRFSPAGTGFELVMSGAPKDTFSWSFPGADNVRGKLYAGDRGATWLTPAESQARRFAARDESAVRLVLQAAQPPEEIEVQVNRATPEPTAIREVVFLTPRGARLNPDLPPEQKRLFAGSERPRGVNEISPEGLGQAAFRLRLPAAQAGLCEAELVRAPAISERDLKFVPVSPDDGTVYHGTRLLELQTVDGVRSHFYGHGEVESELRCSGLISWEDSAFPLDPERPWIIDPAALSLDPQMRLSALFDHYRFETDNGVALSLAAPGGRRLWMDDRLSKALFEDGMLHVAGRPARIMRAVSDETPYRRRFRVTFPDLPAPIPAPGPKDAP